MQLKQSQSGAGLIEVLIAVVILAVGLLGFSAIQTQAMRMNYETMQRSRASALAEDIIDRMRANAQEAISSDNYLRDFGEDDPIVNTDCASDVCTASEMASWDLKNWLETLRTLVPGADAEISKELTDGSEVPNYVHLTIRLVETSELKLINAADLDIEQDELIDFHYYALM